MQAVTGLGARRVVAVVGKGHLPGLVWALCGAPPSFKPSQGPVGISPPCPPQAPPAGQSLFSLLPKQGGPSTDHPKGRTRKRYYEN